MSNLLIVESPAKAKTIQKYLGKNYKVMASMGHLRDLPKSQLGVDIEHDFAPKYITIRGKAPLVNDLKKQAKNSAKVFLATDPDREGEAIAWHLATLLGLDPKSKCRVTFNEITKTAVQAAMKQPRAIDFDLVDAQQARRIIDRILGYKLSPLLWKKVKKGLSAGRVQSVTTKLIVDREREIEAFDPKEYWTITADVKTQKDKKSFEARFYGKGGKKMELADEAATQKVVKHVTGKDFVVQKVDYGTRERKPAPPFTTSTLQQEASKKLGFTSKKTMSTAQMLYEGVTIAGRGVTGLITYMRTDSLRISAEAQAEARAYLTNSLGAEFVSVKPRVYKSKKDSQDAHEAIRPSLMLDPLEIKDSLTGDQFKLYKLIWSRFMASQMANAVYDTVAADIDADGYTFKSSGFKLKFAGFTMMYVEASDEKENAGAKNFPALTVGEKLNVLKIEPKQHFTEPPPRYTEASIIKTMEEQGIGRPSTYAPTITTILARGYVTREKKTLYPTELGFITTDLMRDHFADIVDVEFTANMEGKLDFVAEGKEPWDDAVDEFYQPFSKTLSKAEEEIGKIEIKDEVSDVICEKCGRHMVYKMGRFGKFLACPGFPECRNAKPIIVETGVPCPKCGGMILEKKSKRGKLYYGCEKNPECDFMLWDKPINETCPKCGSLMVTKGGKKICSNKECGKKAN